MINEPVAPIALFCQFTDKNVSLYGTGSVKLRKTRHKISVDIRMFFTVYSASLITIVVVRPTDMLAYHDFSKFSCKLSLFIRHVVFLARDVIYTSRAYATMSVSVCLSVCLSVTKVHWLVIANLGFKF